MASRENIGYIKLHRSILSHWIWPSSRKFTETEAWLFLLLMAAYHSSHVFLRGQQYDVARGQIVISKRTLAARWSWTVRRVRSFLTLLEADGMIVSQTDSIPHGTNLVSRFTIVNYDKLQSGPGTIADPIAALTDEPAGNFTNSTGNDPRPKKKRNKEDKKGAGSDSSRSVSARATSAELLADTMLVLDEYCRRVKPEGRKQHRARAAKSISALLKSGKTAADLLGTVEGYAKRDMPDDPAYRYIASNFFGRAGYFRDYLGSEPAPSSPLQPNGAPDDGLTETDRILQQRLHDAEPGAA